MMEYQYIRFPIIAFYIIPTFVNVEKNMSTSAGEMQKQIPSFDYDNFITFILMYTYVYII